jgi:glucose/mannose-6-phosphate isomerase
MLDDLKLIHNRDASDALGIAQKQWKQYQEDYDFKAQPIGSVDNIIVAGMGGSGLAAKAFVTWPGVGKPFEVVQGYDLPGYVSENTLLIVSSYSGNTEETVSVFKKALNSQNKPTIVVVASGGELEKMANQNNLPLLKLPGGLQPRMTFGYQLRGLCEIFKAFGLIKDKIPELNSASSWLKDEIESWIPTEPTNSNLAKQLALEVIGKSAVIYSSSTFFPVAYKWKISFNENAKNVAWCNQYSEFNHNEFVGWTSHPTDKPYTVIDLRSDLDNDQIKKRFVISAKLLSGKRPAPEVVELKGKTKLEQMLWGVALGDFVSLYTAILNGLDPTPVDLIEKLKLELA